MKVQTVESLKIGTSDILPPGATFVGAMEDFPQWLQDLVNENSPSVIVTELEVIQLNEPPASKDKSSTQGKAGGKAKTSSSPAKVSRKKLPVPK